MARPRPISPTIPPGGAPTNWSEAREQTLQQWLGIRDALGRAHPTDLLTDVNLICSLCERAEADREEQRQPSVDRCAYCIAFQQGDGCREVCAEISTRIAERDWEAARAIADDFIEVLRGLVPPSEAHPRETG